MTAARGLVYWAISTRHAFLPLVLTIFTHWEYFILLNIQLPHVNLSSNVLHVLAFFVA